MTYPCLPFPLPIPWASQQLDFNIHDYMKIEWRWTFELILFIYHFLSQYLPNNFCRKINNFYSTNDRESCEKSHGATNCRKHIHKLCWSVFWNFVKCWGIKEYSYKSQIVFPFKIWNYWLSQLMGTWKGNLHPRST